MLKQACNIRLPAVVMAVLAIVMSTSATLAHHPLGGATPATFWHGLLSGLGHPMIGFDHFAFVIAAGIASAFVAGRFIMPLLFVTATIVGCLLHSSLEVTLPFAEFIIAASVLIIGAMAMSDKPVNALLVAALFSVTGLFHGGAYAEAIVGAETSPLVAYILGFGLIQAAVMLAAMTATRLLSKGAAAIALQSRFAGAVVAGVGATFLIENIEAAIFPSL